MCQTEGFYACLKIKVNGFHVLWQNMAIILAKKLEKYEIVV